MKTVSAGSVLEQPGSDTERPADWLGGSQLRWQAKEPGDSIRICISVARAGEYVVGVRVARLADGGTFQLHASGQAIGPPCDCLLSKARGATSHVIETVRLGLCALDEDPEGGHRVLAYLRSGDYFGEIALLANVPRTATVRAVTQVGLYSLVRTDFEEATVAIGSSSEQMVDTIMDIRRLRGIPIFRGRSEGELSVLLTKLELKTWDPDAVVFQQGDSGDKFYVIRSGEVAIEVSDNGGPPREVATLRGGEYFGEIALVSEVARTASARVKVEAELWALAKEDFLELFEASQLTAQALKRTASRRLIHLSQ